MRRKKLWKQAGLALAVSLLLAGCSGQQKKMAEGELPEKTEEVQAETDDAEKPEQKTETSEMAKTPDLHDYDFTCAFAGDINLADDWNTMEFYGQQENGIYDCIDPQLIHEMQQADLTCVNLEFCLSDRGAPMAGKKYTFRAKPKRAEILKELGVDLANLANNHI